PYIWIEVGFYLLMSTAAGALPSASTLFATGQQMIVVGLALSAWVAWRSHDYGEISLWVAFDSDEALRVPLRCSPNSTDIVRVGGRPLEASAGRRPGYVFNPDRLFYIDTTSADAEALDAIDKGSSSNSATDSGRQGNTVIASRYGKHEQSLKCWL